MRIYLIGMPGVGKSSVGIKLSEKMNYEFVDLDTYIEKKAMMFIDEIFLNYGEKYFRSLESNSLEELKNNDNVIISTGGGIIINKDNKKLMDGVVIYLSANLMDLNNRIASSNIDRPLLKTKSLSDLYEERKELYDYFKDYEIINNDLDETVERIIKIINENKSN